MSKAEKLATQAARAARDAIRAARRLGRPTAPAVITQARKPRLAYVNLPQGPQHVCPRFTVERGIRAVGDEVWQGYAGKFDRSRYSDCAAIVWTPRRRNREIFRRQAEIGGKVIVLENGYFKDAKGQRYFSFGFDGYNGTGDHRNANSPPDRWEKLGLRIEAWRRRGTHILVLGQRGMGPPEVAHDHAWPAQTVGRLIRLTGRPIVYRPHPGSPVGQWPSMGCKMSVNEPLEQALHDCWAVVTYKSTAALTALRLGIPAFAEPGCFAARLGSTDLDLIDAPIMPDGREQFFFDLAYAQWNEDEIGRGEAWRWLMEAR